MFSSWFKLRTPSPSKFGTQLTVRAEDLDRMDINNMGLSSNQIEWIKNNIGFSTKRKILDKY